MYDLTIAPEYHHLSAYRLILGAVLHALDVDQAERLAHLQEVVAQHRFGELLHAERIEAPVDGVPALEGIVRRNQDRVWAV